MAEQRRFAGLRERVLIAVIAMIALQVCAVLALQASFLADVRTGVSTAWLDSLDQLGALDDCLERPGPWGDGRGWALLWPLDAEGRPVGTDVPLDQLNAPLGRPGTIVRLPLDDGREAMVWSAESPSCPGVIAVQASQFPVLVAESDSVARTLALRLGVAALVALGLVALTAVPLVRRIRTLSTATEEVVDADFEGAIPITGPGDELDDLAAAFNAAAQAARERLAALNQRDVLMRRGLADLAHDLRTPLATLKLTVGRLDTSAEATASVRAELEYLDGLVRNFDALLRLGQPHDPDAQGDVDLGPLVERLGIRFETIAGDREVSLAVAPPDADLVVRGDAIALEQAAGNLVQNAVRWATENVAVLAFRRGDEAVIEVRDDGPGIDPDEVPRLAERRTRGEDAGGRGQGFGLGLAIADEAARRHGGRLELEPLPDGGTRGAIVLPIREADEG